MKDPRIAVAPGLSREADGTLAIGGVATTELARRFGTPLLVIDGHKLDATLDAFSSAARASDITLAYAAKALMVVALARRLVRRGDTLIDICSLGELVTAEAAGAPADRLYMHGCGKSDAEIDAAIAGRVAFAVIDGLGELERFAQRAQGRSVVVGLRANSGVEALTHSSVRTGGEDTKFGMSHAEFAAALDLLARHPNLEAKVLHGHLGSKIFDAHPFEAHVEGLLDVAAIASARGLRFEQMIIGGGFGVHDDPATPQLDPAGMLGQVARHARGAAEQRNLALPHLGIEPGRALVASAGTSLYSVAAIKRSATRRFVVIDGSLADNPRPALYGAFHRPLIASTHGNGLLERATIAGRSCENDEFFDAELPLDLARGDLLALCTTGAYTYSMASNYNRFGRPPVIVIDNAQVHVWVRRETPQDVMRNDILDEI